MRKGDETDVPAENIRQASGMEKRVGDHENIWLLEGNSLFLSFLNRTLFFFLNCFHYPLTKKRLTKKNCNKWKKS